MSHGFTVVRRAVQQAQNPPEGMVGQRGAPEVGIHLQGFASPLVGAVTFYQGDVFSLARRAGPGDEWEQEETFINPDHVVCAFAVLIPAGA